MYDIIIVGGGPIGSFLSKKFKEKKYNVLIIEKNNKKLKCSGHISKEIFDFIPFNRKFIENEINGVIFNSKCRKYTLKRKKTISYVINRLEFDNFLLESAKNAGVKIAYELFESFEERGDYLLVKTDKSQYKTKILGGCDGSLSTVRKKANLPEPKLFLTGIFTKVKKPSSEKFVEVYLDDSPDFFAWKIPRRTNIEYGIATKNKEKIKEYFEKFAKNKKFEIKEIYGGLIPLIPPKKITNNKVFLCGDAAAQTKPFTGGGIAYGLISANIAANTINPNKTASLKNYEKLWRKKLLKNIWIGNLIRKVYHWPFLFRIPFLKIIEKLPERVQMDTPLSFLKIKY